MPRPVSKAQLLDQSQATYQKLQQEIAALTEDALIDPGIVGEWSIKDVIAHLMAWQQMAINWYNEGKAGRTPVTPSEKYTWREIPALNQEIYETYRDAALTEIQQKLETSHQDIMTLIEATTDEELFTTGVYAWTKSTTLGAYLTSATSSHYAWARKEIRKGLRAKQKQATGDTT